MRSNKHTESDGSRLLASFAGRWSSLAAYASVGLAWYAFFTLVLSVRVESRLWTPVADWAWRQVLAIDAFRDFGLAPRGGALLAYGVLSVFLWLIVEVLWKRQSLSYWGRAAIAWSALQVCLWALLKWLVEAGILAE
jgi:hypothetical protein